MARTIAELTPGQLVHLDETVDGVLAHVPYIYLGLDDSGNARILRQYAVIQKRMHSSNVAVYDGCEADLWMEDEESGFLSRFDAATLAALVSTEIIAPLAWGEDGAQTLGAIARRCFLMSYTEMGFAATTDEGTSFLAALEAFTGLTGNSARITYNESSAAVNAWLRSANSSSQFRYINANGYAAAASMRPTATAGSAPLYLSRQRPSCPTKRRTQSICCRTPISSIVRSTRPSIWAAAPYAPRAPG